MLVYLSKKVSEPCLSLCFLFFAWLSASAPTDRHPQPSALELHFLEQGPGMFPF